MFFQVFVGGRDITDAVERLTYSSVDPGGFESCTIEPRDGHGIRAGQQILIWYGGEVAWMGVVNEAGDRGSGQRRSSTITGLGPGIGLKRNPYSMIYVDRDLGRWGPGTRARRKQLITAGYRVYEVSTNPDQASGLPALVSMIELLGGGFPICEPIYDAGQGNTIASLYYDFEQSNTSPRSSDANWRLYLVCMGDPDTMVGADSGSLVETATSGAGTFTPSSPQRYLASQFYYVTNLVFASDRVTYWRKLAVYGTHTLPKRGTAPGGFYTSDLVRDAALRSGAGLELLIREAPQYIVPHAAYPDAVLPEQIIAEQANAVAWHWGCWEPTNMLSDRPTFRYEPRPAQATAWVHRAECDELQAPTIKYDGLYDKARVSYVDAAGSSGYAEVTLPSPLIDGPVGRSVLQINMGVGSAAAASAYGMFALRLSQAAARGGGTARLPDTVGQPGGARRPACLLKAGRDRLRVIDIAEPLSALSEDNRALDSFRLTRLETTVSGSGRPQTAVTFDGGQDLMEVLNARLAAAALIAGS